MIGALGTLCVVLMEGCASDYADEAWKMTPIFGGSRSVSRGSSGSVYRFYYRDAVVVYNPYTGSTWSNTGKKILAGAGGALGGSRKAINLPNGCLVYACAKAEEIRLHQYPALCGSEVIGLYWPDGRGHALVIYKTGGRAYAEDDRGFVVPVNPWQSRSAMEARRIADEFMARTSLDPVFPASSASFIGSPAAAEK